MFARYERLKYIKTIAGNSFRNLPLFNIKVPFPLTSSGTDTSIFGLPTSVFGLFYW